MARVEVDPNYTGPTFSRATAGTDLFKKEDVQQLAAAVSTHVHDGVHGLAVVPGAATIPGSALTNGSVTLAKLAADSVDSSKIVDGTIATVDLANASVTNAKLNSDTARSSLLTNGGFEVWQRGNGPFAGGLPNSTDRWATGNTGGDTFSISKDTTNVDSGSGAAAACTFVLVGGAGQSSFYQLLRPSEFPLGGRTISLSVRVRTATASAVAAAIGNQSGFQATGAFHPGGGTYSTLTATYVVQASDTLLTIAVRFSASCTAYLDNAMLVVGSVAADYAPLHPADDLARCLRYYDVVNDFVYGTGQCSGPGAGQVPIRYSLKPGTPTITVVGAPGTFVLTAAGGGIIGCTAVTPVTPRLTTAQINATVASGLVAGNATLLQNNGGSFTVEYNP